jgi:hypothetical protein
MRTITTTAGTPIEVDNDALAVIETVSRDLTRGKGLAYGFEDADREFEHLVLQFTDEERRAYLKESLLMSFNRFETDRMMAIVKKANNATAGLDGGASAARKPGKALAAKRATKNTKKMKKAAPKSMKKKRR